MDMGSRKKLSRMTVSDSNWQKGGEMENTGEGQAPLTLTLPIDTGLQGARGSVLFWLEFRNCRRSQRIYALEARRS